MIASNNQNRTKKPFYLYVLMLQSMQNEQEFIMCPHSMLYTSMALKLTQLNKNRQDIRIYFLF